MADDDQFQHGSSTGNNWWDITTTRSRFENTHNETSSSQQASTISTTLNTIANSYGHWPSQIAHTRSRSSSMDPSFTAVSSCSADHHSGVVLANLNSHMMGLGLMSDNGTQNMDWSHNSLFRGEKSDQSSFRQENNFEASSSIRFREDIKSSSVNESKHINPLGFSLDRSRFTSQETTISNDDSSSKIPSHQNLTNSYHQQQHLDSSAAYGLLLPENPQQASYDDLYDQYGSTPEPLVSSSCNKYYQNLLRASPPKKQSQFTNSTPFWNSSSSRAMDCSNDPRRSYFFPMQNNNNAPVVVVPSFDEKPKMNSETKKKNNTAETSNKRPRSDQTTSSFPPFKRKEKMGDRINALQQLVSPFGKTDTASVLSEAIQYIKFLHEQVSVLSTPYIKNGNPTQHHQQYSDILNDLEGPRQDLSSRGLCLVPISSTFPVTHETTVDFWTPTTFGGTFR